jgi:hypothetical protein
MTQEFDPYDVLGVDPKADDATIRGAYRGAAKRAHPDAEGGSREAWDRVEHAHALLTDQRRRAHFDRTGFDDTKGTDDLFGDAAAQLESIFLKIANDFLVNADKRNAETSDVVGMIRDALAHDIAVEIAARDEAESTLKIVEKMRKRLKHRGKGPNLLDHVLANRAQLIGMMISRSRRSQAVTERDAELLKAYVYEFDQATQGWGTGKGISASDLLALQKQMKSGGGVFGAGAIDWGYTGT